MTKWNLLPEDVLNRIYQFKHQLDIKASLRIIQRFQYRTFEHSNVYFNCTSSIKELLKTKGVTTIKTKKLYICLKNYNYDGEEECDFKMSHQYMAEVAEKIDVTIRPYYDCPIDTYPFALLIKYNKSKLNNPITRIEMIELVALLKISFFSFLYRRVMIEQIYTDKLNYQITCINLDLSCY
jgi:hypothetical protein